MQNIFGLTPPPDSSETSGLYDARPRAFEVSRLVAAFGQWFWEFAAVLVLIVVMGIGYIALLRDPSFVSEARLFVRVSQEQTPPQTVFAPTGVNFLANASGDVISEIDLFLNGDLIDRVIDAANLEALVSAPRPEPATLLGKIKRTVSDQLDTLRGAVDEALILLRLKNRLTLREALVEQIRQSIRVQNTTGSNVIVVGMEWGDRNVPQPLLEHYLAAFLDFRVGVFSTGEPGYFRQQKDEIEAELAALTDRQATLREQSGIHSLEDQRALIVTALETERESLNLLQNHLALARGRLVAMRQSLPNALALANIPEHALLVALDETAVQLFADARAARAGPDRAEIEAKLQSIRTATEQTLREHVATLELNIAASQDSLNSAGQRLSDLGRFEADWLATARRLEVAEANYRFFAERLSELQSLEDLRAEKIGNIVVLQEPSTPRFSQRVRNKTLLAVIAIFSVIGALTWIAMREFLDNRLRSIDDVEDLTGVPPLAVLPRRENRDKLARIHALAAAELANRLKKAGSKAVTVMSVHSDPKDPKSAAVQLAQGFYAAGSDRVLIINLNAWPGSSRTGDSDVPSVRKEDGVEVLNLWSPSLVNQLMKDFEAGVMDRFSDFDILLLVAPPLEASPIGLRAGLLTRCALVRLHAGKDSIPHIHRMLQKLAAGGVQLTGTYLFDWRPAFPRFLGSGPA